MSAAQSQPTFATVDGVPWWEAGSLPALAPPPGVIQNFNDPLNKHWQNVLTISVCWSVAGVLTMMRMYTKVRLLKTPGWDDYTGLLAYVMLIAYGCVTLAQDHYGDGRHLWNVTGNNFTAYDHLVWVNELIYNPTIFMAKLSIILLYLRVFKPIFRTSVTLHIVLWTNLAFYLLGEFVEAFQCQPVEKAWLPLMNGHCINQQAAQISSAAINSASDIAILLLPVSSVWSLKVHRKGKIGLFIIFSFGLAGCALSITRLALFASYGSVHTYIDGTWVYYPLKLLSASEITCAIICSCLPAAPAFLRHISGFKIKVIVSHAQNKKILNLNSSFGNSADTGNSAKSAPKSPFSPFSPYGGQAVHSIGGRPLPSPRADTKSPEIMMQPWGSAPPAVMTKGPRVRNKEQYDELDDLRYVRGDEWRSPPTTPSVKNDADDDLEKGEKLAKMGFGSRR